jgi:hypothetical protein
MAHLGRTGRWPSGEGGAIPEAPGWTWATIDYGCRVGGHGMPRCGSLPRLLDRILPDVRSVTRRQHLTYAQIRQWAREYHERHGRWPAVASGEIPGSGGITWLAVDHALRRGNRGLPGNSSLTKLIGKFPGTRFRLLAKPLTIRQILEWAEDHFSQSGRWPSILSGRVLAAPGEKWVNINMALKNGQRGLPSGYTLATLLGKAPGSDRSLRRSKLTQRQILEWADMHFRRHERWPRFDSGTIAGAPGETWAIVDSALKQGSRGLPGGTTLAQLLHRHRRAPYMQKNETLLTEAQILAWADAHRRRTGRWPTGGSGPVFDDPTEDWRRLRDSLYEGTRGLPGGSSIARLLAKHRDVPHQKEGLRPRIRRITAADRLREANKRRERRKRRQAKRRRTNC